MRKLRNMVTGNFPLAERQEAITDERVPVTRLWRGSRCTCRMNESLDSNFEKLIFPHLPAPSDTHKNMHTTMEDIARECGVTKMTVSRVLAGRDGVKKSTREKVLETATRLNYEINALAQSFNTNRSGFIGLATPFDGLLGSSYFKDAVNGFRRVLDDTVFSFSLFDTNSESFNNGEKLGKLYRQRRADALLLLAVHTTDRFLETLEQLQVPMVVVGERVEGAGGEMPKGGDGVWRL